MLSLLLKPARINHSFFFHPSVSNHYNTSMGNNQPKLSRQADQNPHSHSSPEVPQQFRPSHQFLRSSPNQLIHLLSQCPRFGANLPKYLGNCVNDYQEYVELVNFFRKTEVKARKSQFVRSFAGRTSLLDRFLIVVLGVGQVDEYERMQMDESGLEGLLLEFMSLFIANPQKGFISKLKKYLHLSQAPVLLTDFTRSFCDALPQTGKNIRDYITSKFRDMVKQGHLLRNFNSVILKEDAVILSLKIPEMTGQEIKQLYSSDTNGLSFHSYEKRIIGYDGPWLLLIESCSEKQAYKFGAFQLGPIRDIVDYQGDLRGFMFSIDPNIRFMTTDKGEQAPHYFFINTIDEKIAKRRRGIGFGGDVQKQNCKLWVDQDLDKSTVFNGNDRTYGFGALADPMSTALAIRRMEIWGLGSQYHLEKQAQYWRQRQQEAYKRRKVDKKQFLNGNASMMFEKTFAHRDQVVGQIEQTSKKPEP